MSDRAGPSTAPREEKPTYADLEQALIECAKRAGADISDGVPTWPPLHEWAVQEVQEMRDDYDACDSPEATARAEKAEASLDRVVEERDQRLALSREELEELDCCFELDSGLRATRVSIKAKVRAALQSGEGGTA